MRICPHINFKSKMFRSFGFFVFVAFFPLVLSAAASADSVQKDATGFTLKLSVGILRLQVWSDRIVRVTWTRGDNFPPDGSLSIIARPAPAHWELNETADFITLNTKSVRVQVGRQTGSIDFQDSSGKSFLAEPSGGGHSMEPIMLQRQSTWKIKQVFQFPNDEAIFGLGQHQDGSMNLAGKKIHLQQQNMLVGIPVLMSSRGYGIFWDNPSITDVASGTAADKPGTIQWASEVGDAVDYYVLYGPDLDQSIADYRFLTGSAPMFGRWAWGFWQSKERYASQDELLWIVDQYRSRHIPIDGIIQDWQYWSPGPWGSHKLDPSRYYDPKGLLQKLHANNIHMLISVWAKFDPDGQNYRELQNAGVLFPRTIPSVFPKGEQKWYDPFGAKGRDIYWKQISKNLFSLGIDGWWLDATEPELSGKWGEFRDYTTAAGSGARVFNAYPLMTTSAVYQGQRAESTDKRVLILTRSAYAGQQRNAAITWSGDIHGKWDVFAEQIPAGINFCLSGIPYWNTDIGGFFGSNPADPKYRELFTRWFQFGAFCPMFRVHGTDQPKEIWRFPDDTSKILVRYDQLRYRLLPYIYSNAWSVTHDDSTMMRGLVMDFRNDPKALNIPDQYMFGPAIMVNPVTRAGAATRPVYLPASDVWFDFWTGKSLSGGQTINASAPIQTIPLFIRAGSIIPLGPPVDSAMKTNADPIELRVYAGKDGAFNLYEDEGDNYDYEKGIRAVVPITWNDSQGLLTIGARQGEFPGMLNNRTFRIVRVRDGVGAGPGPAEKVDAEVSYSGLAVDVPMSR
jgi:alpha-D-xyloside xylohydrolase